MPTYISDQGNAEVWAEKPEGYYTPAEWLAANPLPEPQFNPGPEYEKRRDDWWKVRFTKKDFLLLCGLPNISALNQAINEGNLMAKTIHDLLMAAEYIDVKDITTVSMIQLLTTTEVGPVLNVAEAERILEGLKYEEKVI